MTSGDFGDGPLHHVERPTLPWRNPDHQLTECGLRADSFATWSRSELAKQAKKLGRERLAMVVCMNCLHTSQRWPSWEEDPVGCLGREINGFRGPSDAFRREVVAIAALIEAHREEFDEAVGGLEDVVSLADRRVKRPRR